MKRKIIFSIFLMVLLFGIVSAETCSPSSGYNKCYASFYTDGKATALAKVQGYEPPIGVVKGGYYVGESYIPYKFDGDKFYIYKNVNSWDALWNKIDCDENGCSPPDAYPQKEGKYYLTKNPGDSYTSCPVFVSWDIYYASNGDWAWTTIGWGWLGSGNCFNIKQVECYDDSDCSSNQYCDKSGNWDDWNCKQSECSVGDNKCENLFYFECENNHWKSIGLEIGKCGVECSIQMGINEKCEGTNYYLCESYKFADKGEVPGKCGVELKQNYYRLENNQCTYIQLLPSEKTANDYGTYEECYEHINEIPEEPEQDTSLIVLSILGILIGIGLLIFLLLWLRRKK